MSPRTPEQNEEIRRKTRQQIIDAAFGLFAREGFRNTSIKTISVKAGVSKGLIYHYFSSKKAILESIFRQLTAISDQILEKKPDQNPRERFKQVLNDTFLYIERHPDLMRLMVSLALQPDAIQSVKPYIDAANKRQLEEVTEILSGLGYEDPEKEGLYLGAKLDGIVIGFVTQGKDYPLESMKQKIMEEYVSD